MAYISSSPTKRTIGSGSSRGSFQHQQPTYSQQQPSFAQEQHIYEEQPYYCNEPNVSKPSTTTTAENRRTGGVCDASISLFLRFVFEKIYSLSNQKPLILSFFIKGSISCQNECRYQLYLVEVYICISLILSLSLSARIGISQLALEHIAYSIFLI